MSIWMCAVKCAETEVGMDFNFAERLAAARQERGLTQRQLADRLGVTAQAVSKWETGGSLPDLELLRMIAQQLECSVDFCSCEIKK